MVLRDNSLFMKKIENISRPQLKVYLSDSFDPWLNLATEKWIFEDMPADYRILFLWRNDNTVVIGRFQNPWSECHTGKMQEQGIKLARRQSGGGAVFHDLGNTNFTFLTSKNKDAKKINNTIIMNSLKELGILADTSGRNDLVVSLNGEQRKISGSAFKEKTDRSFHHGTLLIDTDLGRLVDFLNPPAKKLASKGITSVKSRVCNLTDLNPEIDHDIVCQQIIQEFFNYYAGDCPIETITTDFMQSVPQIAQYYREYADWNWRFGETPKFKHQLQETFSWGNIDMHIDAHKGQIQQVKIFSDSLHPEMITGLMDSLHGQSYSRDGVSNAIVEVSAELPMIADYLSEFRDWLIKEIS